MGMYIYYRQCHRSLKPAAIFPIEVELGINLGEYSRVVGGGVAGESSNDEVSQDSNTNDTGAQNQINHDQQGQSSILQDDNSQSFVDDLLLDLGISESADPPIPQ